MKEVAQTPGEQLEEIYEEFYAPEGREERKIKENRKKHEQNKKQDLGI